MLSPLFIGCLRPEASQNCRVFFLIFHWWSVGFAAITCDSCCVDFMCQIHAVLQCLMQLDSVLSASVRVLWFEDGLIEILAFILVAHLCLCFCIAVVPWGEPSLSKYAHHSCWHKAGSEGWSRDDRKVERKEASSNHLPSRWETE